MKFQNFSNPQPPQQPQPQETFREPEFKNLEDFITYCSIFDATISPQSARSIERADLLFSEQLYQRDELIINLFRHISDMKRQIQSAINLGEGVFFFCDAPSYSEKPKEYSLKIIKDRFSQNLKINTTWEKLKKAQIHSLKTYACFISSSENQKFQRWLILQAPPNRNIEYGKSPKNMMGYGSTLPEADLEFHKARIKSFSASEQQISFFVDNKIPLTQQKMFEICKNFDPDVNPNTVAFKYIKFSYPESSVFQFLCQSKIHKFSVNSYLKRVYWEVVRVLRIEDGICPVNLKFQGRGKTVKEAFDMCESAYEKCIINKKRLDQMIAHEQANKLEEEVMSNNLEDEYFFNDLIEEFGEDIIPDRD